MKTLQMHVQVDDTERLICTVICTDLHRAHGARKTSNFIMQHPTLLHFLTPEGQMVDLRSKLVVRCWKEHSISYRLFFF